jgi:hypothetical protein
VHQFTAIALLLVLLAGCGSVSRRPDTDSLRLGSMTYDEVVARHGTPHLRPPMTRLGVELKAVYYSSTHSLTLQNRTLNFYFAEDILVGFAYLSSFENDSTDFDDSSLAEIKLGETTRAEVLGLLGRPNGIYMRPFVSGKDQTIFEYSYHRREHTGASLLRGPANQFSRSALIYFDGNGVVYYVLRRPARAWAGNVPILPPPP